MAEMEKIYCMDRPSDSGLLAELINANKDRGAGAEMAALYGQNQMWNNPFAYLIWMMFANRFGYGNNGTQDIEITSKLDNLGNAISSNQNTNLMMDAINGNHEALHQLQTSLGVDFATLQGAISGVQNAITQVGGQVGMTGQQVINSVLLGNKDLTAAIKDCCCNTQQSILKMGYENQIQTLNQTNTLQERLTNVANDIQRGFSTTTYELQKQSCDIINAGTANTQRIIDALNAHWHNNTEQALADAKLELSQARQNQFVIDHFKTT